MAKYVENVFVLSRLCFVKEIREGKFLDTISSVNREIIINEIEE